MKRTSVDSLISVQVVNGMPNNLTIVYNLFRGNGWLKKTKYRLHDKIRYARLSVFVSPAIIILRNKKLNLSNEDMN